MADLAPDRLREVPLAGGVLDQKDFAGADDPLFAVARGDLDPGIEVDDVLPPRRRMPVEVVIRLYLAEDDAGRRQPLRQLAAAPLLDPFDLNIAEMRLAARIGVEIMESASQRLLWFAWG